jgi:hypothetical protein
MQNQEFLQRLFSNNCCRHLTLQFPFFIGFCDYNWLYTVYELFCNKISKPSRFVQHYKILKLIFRWYLF